jgi:hypothetical protein
MVLDRVFSNVDEAQKTAESLNRGFPDMIFLPFSESDESDLSHYSTVREFELQAPQRSAAVAHTAKIRGQPSN